MRAARSKPIDLARLRDQLDRLHNRGKYRAAGSPNFCHADPYYALSLEEEWGRPLRELERIAADGKA